MRKLIVASCAGALASLGALWIGADQPGHWLADTLRPSSRGYDIFIHDRYFIVRPTVLVINFVVYAAAARVIMWFARRSLSGRAGDGADA